MQWTKKLKVPVMNRPSLLVLIKGATNAQRINGT